VPPAFFPTSKIKSQQKMKNTIDINGIQYPITFNWVTVKIYEKEAADSYYAALDGLVGTSPKATTLIALIYAAIMAAGTRIIDLDTLFQYTLKFKQADITLITTLYLESLPKPDKTEIPEPDSSEAPGE
jgi:hypothetical protein